MKQKLYIALLRADEVLAKFEWPTGLAIYYDPGSASTSTGETLAYCFLERNSELVGVYSRDDCCLDHKLVQRAINRLNQKLRTIQRNLPFDWPGGIHPKMRLVSKRLCRLAHFEPQRDFIASLLWQVREGKALSARQLEVLGQIEEECGGLDAMRRRQRVRWRLGRLGELDLAPPDRRTIAQFTKYAWTLTGLHPNKIPVIRGIENAYRKQRVEGALERARRIAAALES